MFWGLRHRTTSANTVENKDTENTEWISLVPYLVNDWKPFNSNKFPVRYKVVGNIVYLEGLVKWGTHKTIISHLPEEIRPKTKKYFANAIGQRNVTGETQLCMVIGTKGGLDSRRYSKEWTSIACSYILD